MFDAGRTLELLRENAVSAVPDKYSPLRRHDLLGGGGSTWGISIFSPSVSLPRALLLSMSFQNAPTLWPRQLKAKYYAAWFNINLLETKLLQ